MSPVKACNVHGAPNCQRCTKTRPVRRRYSDTAEYRRVMAEVLEIHGPTCVYCGGNLEFAFADPMVAAHIVPHADGGEFTVDNIRPAHQSCNQAAGRTPIVDG